MTDPTATSLEPVVGVHGLRTFRVSLDGNLLPLTQLTNDWAGGRCVARCAVGGEHTVPETACTCGIHSFRDRAHLAKQFAAADSLVAVVALEGATVEGDRGWRSQAAQVVAVWIADDALPPHLRTALLERLPGVREYSSPEEMVAAYPGLTCSGGYPLAPSLPREASTVVSGLVRRWGLIQAATFLLTVGVKTAVLSCLLQMGLVDSAEPQGVLQSPVLAHGDPQFADLPRPEPSGSHRGLRDGHHRRHGGRDRPDQETDLAQQDHLAGGDPVARPASGIHVRRPEPAVGGLVRIRGHLRADARLRVLGDTPRVRHGNRRYPSPGTAQRPGPAPS